MSCSSSKEPDGHSDHYHQGCLNHSGSGCKCSALVEVVPRTSKELDEVQGIQQTKMLVERRREVLLQQLDLSDLEGWSKANQAAAHALLAEYHDIFSLEPRELGCTDLAKH